jgi:hypothetical protein
MKKYFITLTLMSGALIAAAQEKAAQETAAANKESKITYTTSTFKITENLPLETVLAQMQKSNMPVATLPNNDKDMPILKTDQTKYNMPIVGGYQPKAGDQKKIDSLLAPKKP